MNYKRTVEILKTAASQANNDLREEIESAITLIKNHSDDKDPKAGIDCVYNHDGRCWGQKGAPECTAGYGYCPIAKQGGKVDA